MSTDPGQLYERIWRNDAYRAVAPGEHHALRFVDLARPDSTVIDFGAGTGRGARLIHETAGVPVLMLDAAHNCLDRAVAARVGSELSFQVHDLTQPITAREKWGYCTDVMEHVAPADVKRVLWNIMEAAETVYFAISTVPDHFGPALVGEPLHLTVQPHAWWREEFERIYCRVMWEKEEDGLSCFLVTRWLDVGEVERRSDMNCEMARVEENIRKNLALGLQEIAPHQAQDTEIILLAGGPSLADFEGEIYEHAKAGVPVVTVNATYGWALERGILPAAQVMLDARAFNKRFVERVIPTCRYLICSQAPHELVAELPRDQTWLWHSGSSDIVKRVRDEIGESTGVAAEWYPVHGGTTVMLRAIPLLAMLGFRRISIYGWDSCLRGDQHHAYSQPENDMATTFEVTVSDRTFHCHGWMAIQANEFPRVIRTILGHVDGLEMRIHGDGLMAAVLEHTAALAHEEH